MHEHRNSTTDRTAKNDVARWLQEVIVRYLHYEAWDVDDSKEARAALVAERFAQIKSRTNIQSYDPATRFDVADIEGSGKTTQLAKASVHQAAVWVNTNAPELLYDFFSGVAEVYSEAGQTRDSGRTGCNGAPAVTIRKWAESELKLLNKHTRGTEVTQGGCADFLRRALRCLTGRTAQPVSIEAIIYTEQNPLFDVSRAARNGAPAHTGTPSDVTAS